MKTFSIGALIAAAAALGLSILCTFTLDNALSWTDRVNLIFDPASAESFDAYYFAFGTLPRFAAAAIGGALLGLVGSLLQQLTQNPMTSPLTLGTSSGGWLAVVLISAFFPAAAGAWLSLGAFAGALAAFGLILLIAGPRGMTGVALIIAGMVVNLLFGAIATAVVLLRAQFVENVFLWGARDNLGAKLLAAAEKLEAKDDRTFTLDFKKPFGMVLDAFSKPSSIPLFVMPEKVAQTDPFKQITDMTGSGPYMFAADRYRPGEKVVYLKNPYYVPRNEPADGTAGGKHVYVDELDWVILRDAQTVANAIEKGEVDVVEMVPNEQYSVLKKNPDIQLLNQTGKQSAMLHLNHAIPPFNNPKIAQAALMAINQAALQRAQIVHKELWNTCTSIYPCGSLYASDKTDYFTGKPQFKRAQELLKEAGYDGTPVVLMLPADMPSLNKYPPVMAELLRRAGFKVDLQSMDWATLVTRRTKSSPVSEGGWNGFITFWNQADTFNPLFFAPLTGSGLKGWFGWTDDPKLEALKDEFVGTSDLAKRKELAEGIQLRVMDSGVYGMLGEAKPIIALRKNISGLVEAPISVFWGLKKD